MNQWGFPRKRNPYKEDEKLSAIIRDLWSKNYRSKEMLVILKNEHGYDLLPKQLNLIRKKKKLNITSPRRTKSSASLSQQTPTNDIASSVEINGNEVAGDGNHDDYKNDNNDSGDNDISQDTISQFRAEVDVVDITRTVDNEAASSALRAERKRKLEQKSQELWLLKKRRRRVRPRGGLPADPPQPPRFPSEMSLEEAKIFLGIRDPQLYFHIRDEFLRLCRENKVYKKSDVEPARWEDIKRQLIEAQPHLQTQLWGEGAEREGLEMRKISLDQICIETSKLLRKARYTLADAKQVLNLDPHKLQEARRHLMGILIDDEFTSLVEMGKRRFKELKQRWIEDSALIKQALKPTEKYTHEEKMKAVEYLSKDVAKRLKYDLTKGNFENHCAPKTYTELNGKKLPNGQIATARGLQLRATLGIPIDMPPLPQSNQEASIGGVNPMTPSTEVKGPSSSTSQHQCRRKPPFPDLRHYTPISEQQLRQQQDQILQHHQDDLLNPPKRRKKPGRKPKAQPDHHNPHYLDEPDPVPDSNTDPNTNTIPRLPGPGLGSGAGNDMTARPQLRQVERQEPQQQEREEKEERQHRQQQRQQQHLQASQCFDISFQRIPSIPGNGYMSVSSNLPLAQQSGAATGYVHLANMPTSTFQSSSNRFFPSKQAEKVQPSRSQRPLQQLPQPRQQQQDSAGQPQCIRIHPQPPTNIAIYLRPVQSSGFEAQMRIAMLAAGAGVQGIRNEAMRLPSVQDAICSEIRGVVKSKNGMELPIDIRDDEELAAYLLHIDQEGGGTPLFDVKLS